MELDDNDKRLLHRGIDQLTTANAIMRFLSDYFRDKYNLTPDNEITPNGEIVSVSLLQVKEKLNGTPINSNNDSESNGVPTDLSAMLGMSGDVALLHDTTEDH